MYEEEANPICDKDHEARVVWGTDIGYNFKLIAASNFSLCVNVIV